VELDGQGAPFTQKERIAANGTVEVAEASSASQTVTPSGIVSVGARVAFWAYVASSQKDTGTTTKTPVGNLMVVVVVIGKAGNLSSLWYADDLVVVVVVPLGSLVLQGVHDTGVIPKLGNGSKMWRRESCGE
jgi:hypothetical protein